MREWWRDAIIYQIYPRSFQDTSGNGMGDLAGITKRLDHVASVGADAIWLSPFFTSPDEDMGYDVSDYTNISDIYGDMADFDALMARAKELGLKVIIDQVISHSSDQHPWFVESRKDRTNPKADWYVWADPNPDGTPPNNWVSVFGGSAWRFDAVRRQYYLHNFLTAQPDLNFHNPDVVEAHLDAMRFWLDKGVDGFRLDTVNFYVHDDQLRSNPPADWDEFPGNPYEAQEHVYSKNRPENLNVLRRIRALVDSYDDKMLIGEVGELGQRQIEIMGEYTSGTDKLHMAYTFAMLSHDRSAAHFRRCIEGFEAAAPDGWPSWSFSNHDVPRHVTRWTEDGSDPDAVAKQSIAMLISFPGTIGIYQGEELGQTDTDILFHELRDKGYIDFWPDNKGRDGCRSPMVWDASQPNAGFSDAEPWLPVKDPQRARAVSEQQGKNDSVLAAYRAALAFRKSRVELKEGSTSFHDLPEPLLGLTRTAGGIRLTGVFNLSNAARTVKVKGLATLDGPSEATLVGTTLNLPANGYAFLASTEALTLIADAND